MRDIDHGHLWARTGEAALVAVTAEFTAAAVLNVAAVPRLTVLLAAVAVAGGLTVAAIMTARSAAARWHAVAAAAAGPAWIAYTAFTSPWTWHAVAALAVAAALLATLWPPIAVHHARVADRSRRATAQTAEQEFWPAKLAGIGIRGVTCVDRQATLAGYQALLRLPPSGRVTHRTLAARVEQLEVAARMRHGALRFEPVPDRAYEVLLHVAEKDVLAGTYPMPGDMSPASVNDPITIGMREDGQPCQITLREIATLIVGIRGSGKSNLLNVILAQLARCVDVVVFMSDLKGGRTALPWIQPWLHNPGQVSRPVIDWVATTRDETERMLRALLRIIDARSHSGTGGEKIAPSPETPAVIAIFEEVAVIFGANRMGPRTSAEGTTNSSMAGLGTQLAQLGRSEAVDVILVTQRGTVTMTGSGDLKSQCGLRIGLGVASQMDARMIIPDDVQVAADLTKMRHPGSGIVHQGDAQGVTPAKFWRIEHHQIAPVARACGWLKPALDDLSAAAAGEDYANRWAADRIAHLPGSARHAAPPIPPPGAATDVVFESLVATLPDPEGDDGNPLRRRALGMISESGVAGITPAGLMTRLEAEGYTIGRSTLHRWLADWEAADKVRKASYGRYQKAR